MRFVFSRRFYILLAFGLVPLSLSWNFPVLRWLVLVYDVGLVITAISDYFVSRKQIEGLEFERRFDRRFAIGEKAKISLLITNDSPHTLQLDIKDEHPPEMRLHDEREAGIMLRPRATAEFFYYVTPPRRGRWRTLLGFAHR